MLKFKKEKKQFIYIKSIGYINISNISRFYYDNYTSSYKIDLNYTLNTSHSAYVVSYRIDRVEYDELVKLCLNEDIHKLFRKFK